VLAPVAVRALSPDGMSEAGKAVDGFCATTGAERATAVAAALRTDEKKRVATAGHQAPASPTRVAVVVLHSGRGAGSRVWAFGRARGALGVARTGLLALPGGKFSPRGRGDRDLRDAAVCELLEETGLAIGRGRVCPINLSPGFVAMLSCCEHCAADVVFSLFHVSLEDSEIPTIEGVTSNEHVTVTPLDVGAKPSALRAFLPHNHLMVLHWMHHMGGALRRLTAGEYPRKNPAATLTPRGSCASASASTAGPRTARRAKDRTPDRRASRARRPEPTILASWRPAGLHMAASRCRSDCSVRAPCTRAVGFAFAHGMACRPRSAACLHNAASRMDHRGRQKVQLLIDGDVRQESYRRVVPAWRSVSRTLGQSRAAPTHVAQLRHTVRNPLAQHAGETEGANAGRGRRRPPWRSSERKPRRTRIKYA
jgi:8-oxo-dGTP pyrophosphatase MutT (NUDIX family)